MTFYTWTSDQYSQFGTKVVPATMRDASIVLDEILDNETELPLNQHSTDTAGYTEIIFALFDLLGLQFAPRIRDISDQTLYSLEKFEDTPRVNGLLKGKLNPDLFINQWDDLLRLADSMKLGWVTLRKIQQGELLSLPISRPMPTIGARCHELRIVDTDKTWRIVYRIDSDVIVILEVFSKKTRQTPQTVINACQRRIKNYDEN